MSFRRPYIDVARGVAVLLMIEAHTVDAWTRPAERVTIAFRNATVLGGFAAPLFLWLAGLAVALSATRTEEATGSRAAAVHATCRRGLEIFILAFLFRLQAFVLTPGSSPLTLFRVDILNIMGPSLAIAGLIWGAAGTASRRAAIFAGVTLAIAMGTPIIRHAEFVNALPIWVQWYVRPAGEHTTFTSFPWAGFVSAGAACGALIAGARDPKAEARRVLATGLAGVALIAGGFWAATLPSIYREASFWTSSPTWFAIRVGVLMVTLSLLFAAGRAAAFELAPAQVARRFVEMLRFVEMITIRLGRRSLFVYWIHVELVYGYASWFWWRQLPLWGTALGCALFSALMYAAVVLLDRYSGTRRQPTPTLTTAQAKA